MTLKFVINFIALIFLLPAGIHADVRLAHHQLAVELDPGRQFLQVSDHILVKDSRIVEFTLHAGMNPRIVSPGARLVKTGHHAGQVPLDVYRAILDGSHAGFVLEYAGRITNDFRSRTESPGRERRLLTGTISADGVFLDATVAWFPVIDNVLQTFDLRVTLPQGWMAVSQGMGPQVEDTQSGREVSWRALQPQDDIYLIAGQYKFYNDEQPDVEPQVFLRQADDGLARQYLQVTSHYIEMYQELIGKYPYAKFALVENFWETGYGMPSFTLLGPRVLRLPFILHSSYPHEILHNWWGNGVHVDYQNGNWSEGLTAYLADHLIKEQQGQGVQHRRSSLQRYADFVRKENDFPLVEFLSRHSGSSQAVGYDKSMMLFHMLRRKLGDEVFIQGLRRFYQDNLFRKAGYRELQRAFEQVDDLSLGDFFSQWTHRTSAPSLQVRDSRLTRLVMGYRIELQLWQIQESDAFALEIPVFVYPEDGSAPWRQTLQMDKRAQSFTIDVPGRPARIDIDPWFDVFRRLHPSEAPSTLSRLFGNAQVLFVLPGGAPDELLQGYHDLAEAWSRGYEHASIKLDHELQQLPDNQDVWLLGWNNRFCDAFLGEFSAQQFSLHKGGVTLAGHELNTRQHSLVLTQRRNESQVIGWVATQNAQSLPGLTRKLPHYGKYSYLAFQGGRPTIEHKGLWAINRSALKIPLLEEASTDISEQAPTPLWPMPGQ